MTTGPEDEEGPQPPDPEPLTGPPGASVFSLERRPAAGLYLVSWLLSVGGLALAFIGIQSPPGAGRLLIVAGLAVLALGLATAAGYQILARSSRPVMSYRGASPVLLFFLAVVALNLVGVVIVLATGRAGLDVESAAGFFVGVAIQVAGYVGVVGLFVLAPRVMTWREIANNAGASLAGVVANVANAVGLMLPVTLVALIVGGMTAVLVDARPPEVVPVPETGADALVDFIGAVVLIPIGEELFFRGFALRAWWRDLGARGALIRSSLFFGLVHILNVQAQAGQVDVALRSALVLMVVIVPIGFVLGWLYIRRGLVASIAAHMTYNGIIFGLLLLTPLLPAK